MQMRLHQTYFIVHFLNLHFNSRFTKVEIAKFDWHNMHYTITSYAEIHVQRSLIWKELQQFKGALNFAVDRSPN